MEEYVAQLDSGRYVWVRVEVNLLQKPENGEIIAFIYNHDVTRESKLKQILECIMTFGYDEIYTVDEYTGQMDEFVSGQYALDSQAEQNQYEGSCNVWPTAWKRRKKRSGCRSYGIVEYP